jgi:FkbM family methyltransferase
MPFATWCAPLSIERFPEMNLLKAFKKPEYVFRPRQVLLKLGRTLRPTREMFEDVTLPWGATIRICPNEHIGSRIWHRGVFDLVTLEAIARLVDPGDTALDIGANIGQMATLLSRRAGPNGRVLVFDPHPEIFKILSENIARLKQDTKYAQVILHNLALSDHQGEALLDMGSGWKSNQGLARLAEANGSAGANLIPVRISTVDAILGPEARVAFCKLDVEGHELKVLQGASQALREHRIRDIIFEDFGPYPSAVQQHLANLGYTLFALDGRINRPVLSPNWRTPEFDGDLEGADFLATLDPSRASARFAPSGWSVLSGRNR